MKIIDIEFKRAGCCGEYLNAQVDLNGGKSAVITDNKDGTYTVAIMVGGLLNEIHRGIDAASAEALLA